MAGMYRVYGPHQADRCDTCTRSSSALSMAGEALLPAGRPGRSGDERSRRGGAQISGEIVPVLHRFDVVVGDDHRAVVGGPRDAGRRSNQPLSRENRRRHGRDLHMDAAWVREICRAPARLSSGVRCVNPGDPAAPTPLGTTGPAPEHHGGTSSGRSRPAGLADLAGRVPAPELGGVVLVEENQRQTVITAGPVDLGRTDGGVVNDVRDVSGRVRSMKTSWPRSGRALVPMRRPPHAEIEGVCPVTPSAAAPAVLWRRHRHPKVDGFRSQRRR